MSSFVWRSCTKHFLGCQYASNISLMFLSSGAVLHFDALLASASSSSSNSAILSRQSWLPISSQNKALLISPIPGLLFGPFCCFSSKHLHCSQLHLPQGSGLVNPCFRHHLQHFQFLTRKCRTLTLMAGRGPQGDRSNCQSRRRAAHAAGGGSGGCAPRDPL